MILTQRKKLLQSFLCIGFPLKTPSAFSLHSECSLFFLERSKKWCHIPSTIMGQWQPLLLPTLHSFHLSALWTLQISCFYPHTMAHTQRRRRSTSFLNTSSRKSFTGFFFCLPRQNLIKIQRSNEIFLQRKQRLCNVRFLRKKGLDFFPLVILESHGYLSFVWYMMNGPH